MASSKERIVACIKGVKDAAFTPAKFSCCLLDSLGLSEPQEVYFRMDGNNLNLSVEDSGNSCKRGLLRHPKDCPAKILTDEDRKTIKTSVMERGVDVGSNVVVQTSDDYIFLTRRSLDMKTFPGLWVPPGGHLESGETLEQAGLRELQEETGLDLHHLADQMRVLGLWESLYPPIIIKGFMEPRRHHCIAYFALPVAMTKDVLETQLQLNSSEVCMAAWFPKPFANFLGSLKYSEFLGHPLPDQISELVPPEIPAVEFDKETGRLKSILFSTSLMLDNIDVFSATKDSHRLSLGTMFALSRLRDEDFVRSHM